MNLNNISFPYPVLGSYDDIMPRPELPKASIVVENGMYVFTIALKYDNKDIRDLINDDFADHVCEVVCPATRFRKCFMSKDGNFEIRIPKKQLGGKITFSCTVTVKRMILNYKNEGFHADYVGHRFDMEPGDILAVFDQITYNADIKYDKLKAVGSFMVIEETTDPIPQTLLDREKIRLLLPTELYNSYKDDTRVNSNPDILHASLVLNSLIFALCRFDQYANKKWAETVMYRIQTDPELAEFRETDPDEWRVDKLSQLLLGKPYERLFRTLSQPIDGE